MKIKASQDIELVLGVSTFHFSYARFEYQRHPAGTQGVEILVQALPPEDRQIRRVCRRCGQQRDLAGLPMGGKWEFEGVSGFERGSVGISGTNFTGKT